MTLIIGFLPRGRKGAERENLLNWEPENAKARLSDMRWLWRLTKVLALLAILVFVLAITGASDKLMFYATVIKLYSQSPDTKLAMPLENVSKRAIADTWQAARGITRRHEGQDIFAPRGTPILSATKGVIYNVGENTLGGQTVSVIGAGGRVYYYAHLDSYARNIKVGDPVTTRTVLGYVGTTGNAQGTPPHLHFGVYTSTGAINPLPLLTDRNVPTVTTSTPRDRTLANHKT